ncbi:MAG: hypothetical protein QNJ41_17695 [Xenococcaceae cyanobacterium MO_188.B32]|nr:hypothetical protein [Xenococcaceae cyanobacterium MO_188.B32]
MIFVSSNEEDFCLATLALRTSTVKPLGDRVFLKVQAMVKEGLRNVAAGANPINLKRGIDFAVF